MKSRQLATYELFWEGDPQYSLQEYVREREKRHRQIWIVCEDQGGIGERLVKKARASGIECITLKFANVSEACSEERRQTMALMEAQIQRERDRLTRLLPGVSITIVILYLWTLDVATDIVSAAIESTITECCMTLINLLRAVVFDTIIDTATIYCVTSGAQAVDERGVTSIMQTPVLGLLKSLIFEHPEFTLQTVDLDPSEMVRDIESISETLLLDIVREEDETHIGYRGGARYVQRLREMPMERIVSGSIRKCWSPEKIYIVTGPFGFIGKQLTDSLIAYGARSLALLGRHGPDERARRGIQTLLARGIKVSIFEVDVADREALRRCLEKIEKMGQPIGGVLHLASDTSEDCDLIDLSEEHLHLSLHSKAIGAWNLHEMLTDHQIDCFVLFSSATTILGSPAQGAVSAANAFLDGLALYRRGRGLPALVLNWGTWTQPGDDEAELFAGVDPEKAMAMTQQLMDAQAMQVLVIGQELDQVLSLYPRAESLKLFVKVARTQEVRFAGFSREQLSTEYILPRTRVERVIAVAARRALGVTRIGVHDEFFELGGDSVTAAAVLTRISRVFGVEIALEDAIEAFTVERLAAIVEKKMLDQVKAMSEEEARMWLGQRNAETTERPTK